jgi:two-component system repressor protein LuxO
MPPLRERGEDILLIAKRFLEQFAEAEHKEFKTFSPDAEAKLLAYSWPGNVRQLQNVVRNVVVLHNGKEATAEMLPVLDPVTAPPTATVDTPVPPLASARPSPPLPANAEEIELLNVAERRYIERAIELCSGNLQLAARKLGVSPSTIYRKREAWAKE